MDAPQLQESPRRDTDAPPNPSPLPPPLQPAPGKQREEKKTALSKSESVHSLEYWETPSVSAGNHFTFNCEVKAGYCCSKAASDKGKSTFLRLYSSTFQIILAEYNRLSGDVTESVWLETFRTHLDMLLPSRSFWFFNISSGYGIKHKIGGCTKPLEIDSAALYGLLLTLLYPHLYSRAYINFRNPEDILLFRDRFDGYVFIDNKGLEYPAVVEFAPFQKISKKKLKKKDAKAGSIEDDPEYRKFLENYCTDEDKICANPEILLGEIEAKTRELIARRTTPLLEYIKNRKLEKQRIREEKREERRRRELEKKRLREEEKRKRREEERRKRKEVEKQKKISEKEIRIKLLRKPEKGDELASEKHKEKGEEADTEENKWDKSPGSGSIKSKSLESSLKEIKEKSQNDSDKEQRDLERRFREKEPERQRYRLDDGRKHRTHYEFDKFMRRNEEELKWGKGYNQDRGKKGNYNYSFTVEAVDKLGKEDKCDDMASKKERIRNKDRPAMQLYQPGARIRTHMGPTSKTYDCSGKSFEDAPDKKYEADNSAGAGSEKTEEAE
ncbi:regulator of nonsense transcripts 3A-like [Pyrgilauda ruficollis]|uniref:regulator of nonsense transcripts 3A-like n=1 Tax=Pyrgilauda ruficollis TaxID=221976 RepID=UPI001B874102|nr:regulator of nonsense transcripts 3A-like [Pyrgilauda ruficollis]